MDSLKNMARNLTSIRSKLDQKIGVRDTIKKNKKRSKKKIAGFELRSKNLIQAVTVTQEVARLTQEELELELCSVVTAAIQAIFKEPHKLVMNFNTKRGKTEIEILVSDENDNESNLFTDDGGGILDIVALLLRFSCWRLSANRTSPFFLFDEPMKNLSAKFRPAAIQFLKEFSDKLGVQIIMVTHIPEFIKGADNVIRIGG